MSRPDIDVIADEAMAEGQVIRRDFRQTMLSGLALTVPFFITLLVLVWVLDFISGTLGPFVDLLALSGLVEGRGDLVAEMLAVAILFGIVFAVGLMAQHGPKTQLGHRFDTLMEDIPGIGSIYTGVERMSDVLIEGDTESFREVKLVEFPDEGSFAIAFLTADTPPEFEDAAGRSDMLTVFVPMAPNPVMGGHLLSLPSDRVHDVDISVEEGMEAIMTSGIAIDPSAQDEQD